MGGRVQREKGKEQWRKGSWQRRKGSWQRRNGRRQRRKGIGQSAEGEGERAAVRGQLLDAAGKGDGQGDMLRVTRNGQWTEQWKRGVWHGYEAEGRAGSVSVQTLFMSFLGRTPRRPNQSTAFELTLSLGRGSVSFYPSSARAYDTAAVPTLRTCVYA